MVHFHEEQYELHDRLKKIEKEFSQQIEAQVEEEIKKRTFKISVIFSTVAMLLGILGYTTWQEIPRIAKDTAMATVQSETSLVVLEELKVKGEEIRFYHSKIKNLLDGLENDYSTVIKLVSLNVKNDDNFRLQIKGEKGEEGVPGKNGINGKEGAQGKKGEQGESAFPKKIIYGTISPSGNILSGQGFTVIKEKLGRYKVIFDSSFKQRPLILAMPESHKNLGSGIIISIVNDSKSKNSFSLETLLSKNNNWVDTGWQFIAFSE
jgi:hypothetical protein